MSHFPAVSGSPSSHRTVSCTGLVLLMLAVAPHSPAGRPGDILGRWEGTSTCVRADWNRSCNDEVIRYDFVLPGSDSNAVLLHAYRIQGDTFVPMGDLELTRRTDPEIWEGEFANSRVHIRWSYRLSGDTLHGQVVTLPGQQVARHVLATRPAHP